jgi:Ras-related protein Rab-2A
MIEENSIKVILIGASGTGKTNIIKALVDKPFEDSSESTLTSTFVSKRINVNYKDYKLEIWDTARQEMYKSLTKIFLVNSKIVIFVYDITQKSSFEELDFWINTAKENLDNSAIYAIFANKKDLYLNEEVTEKEGSKKAEEIGAFFRETLAKTERENLNQYLDDLTKEYVKKYGNNEERGHREPSFVLQYDSGANKKRNCCK